MPNIDAKRTMLLHSEAKVEFLKKYLQRYLRILYRAPPINEINIFDVFCGTGIYDNGKKGSPIVSFEAITSVREQFGFEKKINLTVNDSECEKIEAVRKHLDPLNQNHCHLTYNTLSAEQNVCKYRPKPRDTVKRCAEPHTLLTHMDTRKSKNIR